MTALLYLIQIYMEIDGWRVQGSGFRVVVAASPQIVMGRSAPVLLAFPEGVGGPRQQWIGYYRQTHTCKARFLSTSIAFQTKAPYPPLRGTFPTGEGNGYSRSVIKTRGASFLMRRTSRLKAGISG